MTKKKLFGWSIMLVALVVLVIGDSVLPIIMSLFATLAAMVIGGVGMYLAFGDST